MHLDAQRTIDIVTGALLRELSDEVDLIFRYGSLISGTAHHYSDLDISYVPAHDSTGASITVLVDNVMIDLYPIRWRQLEDMADFRNISASVLLKSEIVYQRTEDVGARFLALADRLRGNMTPAARPQMIRNALSLFKQTGYPALLLREEAATRNLVPVLFHAQQIVQGIFHLIAVCNQQPVDTRKPAQVLTLPRLPKDFAANVELFIQAVDVETVASTCQDLLTSTRTFLLAEQADIAGDKRNYAEVFGPAYPEFKGGLNHLLLACERSDLLTAKSNLASLYHELSIHIAWAATGIDYGDFNSLADYEQNFVALGFPALLPHLVNRDFDELHRQCLIFDQRMQSFLIEKGVDLYSFSDLDALERHLAQRQN